MANAILFGGDLPGCRRFFTRKERAMSLGKTILLGLSSLLLATGAHTAPVLMISVDGLRPQDVLSPDTQAPKLPVLHTLLSHGVYATGVRNVLPTVTYPNHITLITGVSPSAHGIANNTIFDPLQKNMSAWYWYAPDIKVQTLWDVVHKAHGTVASFSWPVSVDAGSIDYNIPEYWRAHTPEDAKLLRALSTASMVNALEKATGLTLEDTIGDTPEADDARARFTAALITAKQPLLVTLHLISLDHIEHEAGPGSAKALATLTKLDATIGRLIADARKVAPDTVVAIVSDHGFAPVTQEINIMRRFVEAGLVTLHPETHKVTAWEAMPWGSASAAVVLARPQDTALQAKVKAVLNAMAANPAYQIAHIADAQEIAHMGGTAAASFWIDFKPGAQMGYNPQAPLASPATIQGTHGYFPSHPEMRASFIVAGASIPKRGSLGEIDMRDIAPTLAKIMNVELPQAEGKPLF
jgi:predicted AlkP superfamily pyrophosphatase or phosphodiesterase